jgi:hypothetical protein
MKESAPRSLIVEVTATYCTDDLKERKKYARQCLSIDLKGFCLGVV